MELGDIDWRAGQITIRGKGSRLDQLPLPADAGQAIAALAARRAARLLVPAGLHHAAGPARAADQEGGLGDRDAGGPPRRADGGDRPPAAARCGDRAAARRGEPSRSGAGAPRCQHAEHCPVCPGRSWRAVGGGWEPRDERPGRRGGLLPGHPPDPGLKLEGAGQMLEQFAAFGEAAGADTVTIELALAPGLRWPVEEDFRLGKDSLGLDQCQARLYTAIQRHTVLVMAALAICAVTAARLRDRTDTQAPPPLTPGQAPPPGPGMIPLTVPEIKRLLAAARARRRAGVTPPMARLATRPPGASPLVPPGTRLNREYALVSEQLAAVRLGTRSPGGPRFRPPSRSCGWLSTAASCMLAWHVSSRACSSPRPR